MNTCDTCRWWSKNSPADFEFNGFRECDNPKVGDKGWNPAPPDALGIIPTHDGDAYLLTGPKFGCIHHSLR